MAGEAIAAVIVELRRDEVQLYVRALIDSERGAHEGTCLGDVTHPGT